MASLVCSFLSFLFLPGVLAIVFGLAARSAIKRSEGRQKGSGLALAGIIISVVVMGILILATLSNYG